MTPFQEDIAIVVGGVGNFFIEKKIALQCYFAGHRFGEWYLWMKWDHTRMWGRNCERCGKGRNVHADNAWRTHPKFYNS